MTIPVECQPVQEVIDSFVQERDRLQEELEQADPAIRPFILEQIRRANQAIAIQTEKLIECITGPPLFATFTGTSRMTTTDAFNPGPFSSHVEFGLRFDNRKTRVELTSFPPIRSQPFDTPIGANIVTVTKISSEPGSYGLGIMVLPVTLLFDHSIEVPIFTFDSTLSITLVTSPPGSPIDAQGNCILAGSDKFIDGLLGGSLCNLTIVGRVDPVP